MRLGRIEVARLGPFARLVVPFADEEGEPRLVTVIHGGGGVGKSTLLHAITTTRPGQTTVQQSNVALQQPFPPLSDRAESEHPHVICHWLLGADDPERPHPLCVASPNARVYASDEQEALRRREQAVFDKVAREGGFAFLAIPSTRWFSRQPIAISAPARSVARYDVRSSMSLDDRADLARETKQALAYAGISSALSGGAAGPFRLLGEAMRNAVDALVELSGFSYLGIDPYSFEPMFSASGGVTRAFDALPARARHLVAFAALTVRMLWAAYPGRDPCSCEGVVAIDEVDLQQDPVVQAALAPALRRALPQVQWILTTTSPAVAGGCDTREVLALRRLPEDDHVELFVGSEARTH